MAVMASGLERDTRPSHGNWARLATRGALYITGAAAGLAAGLDAVARGQDIWLAGFAFSLVAYTIGRGLADVLLEPDRLSRVVYYAVLPLVAIGVYVGMYALSWDLPMSVIYGVLVGAGAHALVGWAFLLPPSRD